MKIVERFEEAVRDHEMRGSFRPEDRPDAEAEYRDAKKALIDEIKWLKNRIKEMVRYRQMGQ